MSAEHRVSCGIGALLPMSCRGRAEAFARRLQTRLHHLGAGADDHGDTEESWLTSQPHYPTLHQPRHSTSSESDIYYDFDIESPGSPQEEASEADLKGILLNGEAKVAPVDVESGCVSAMTATSPGSDSSDGNYYDPESFDFPESSDARRKMNGHREVEESHPITITSKNELKNETLTKVVDGMKRPKIKNIEGKVLCSRRESEESIEAPEVREVAEVEVDHDNTAAQEEISETDSIEPSNGDITEDEVESDNERLNRERQMKNTCTTIEVTPAENEVPSKEQKKDEVTFCSTFTRVTEHVVECPTPPSTPDEPVVECVPNHHDNELCVPKLHAQELDDEEEEEERPQRVQRCSSLKTGKTPPGTPGRKKIVRFADVLGLDLADVRTFLDEIPRVPTSAYEDLRVCQQAPPPVAPRPDRVLMPLFQQPGGVPDFLDRVRRQLVCLENAVARDGAVIGTVRVVNLDFNKSVHVRYSLDGWRSYCDHMATYVANSCDGFSDKFSFIVYAHTLEVGQRLEFAVRFQCHGQQYWDSNHGINYIFQCLPPSNPQPFLSLAMPEGDRWASFY